jgi:hypothetical protein
VRRALSEEMLEAVAMSDTAMPPVLTNW